MAKIIYILSHVIMLIMVYTLGCNGVQQLTEIKLLNSSEVVPEYKLGHRSENPTENKHKKPVSAATSIINERLYDDSFKVKVNIANEKSTTKTVDIMPQSPKDGEEFVNEIDHPGYDELKDQIFEMVDEGEKTASKKKDRLKHHLNENQARLDKDNDGDDKTDRDDIFDGSEENLGSYEGIENDDKLEDIIGIPPTETTLKLNNSTDNRDELDYGKFDIDDEEDDDDIDEFDAKSVNFDMRPRTLMEESPASERFTPIRTALNASEESEAGIFADNDSENASPILKRVVRRACKCKDRDDSKGDDKSGEDSKGEDDSKDMDDGESGESSKGDSDSKEEDDGKSGEDSKDDDDGKDRCSCKPDKDDSDKDKDPDGEADKDDKGGKHGYCSIPKHMAHSELKCKVSPSSVKCRQKCVFGYTLKEGIKRTQKCDKHKGRWSPSRRFSDCKPYVDCTIRLKPGGKKKCYTNYMKKPNRCYISCKAYKGKKDVKRKKYHCDVNGKWSPKLPHCARPGTGRRLVPKPHKPHQGKLGSPLTTRRPCCKTRLIPPITIPVTYDI